MKTILIIAGGIAELPETTKTPLMCAAIPAMRVLAGSSETGLYYPGVPEIPVTEESAIMSLFGYDPRKGIPPRELLERIGRDEISLNDAGLQGMVLPGFSGNGSLITTADEIKGIGKLAMLDTPSFPYNSDDWESAAEYIVNLTKERITKQEFVAIYVDWAARISFSGDIKAKTDVLNLIDYNIVNPIADFVWRTDLVMQLSLTSGFTVSTRRKRIENTDVPALIYLNDIEEDMVGEDEFNEIDCIAGTLDLPAPYSLIETLIFNS